MSKGDPGTSIQLAPPSPSRDAREPQRTRIMHRHQCTGHYYYFDYFDLHSHFSVLGYT
jgi:hypothetical protein